MGVLNGSGTPGANLPDGEDWISRRFSDIERFIRELTPSIARSIQPTVVRLDATDVDLAAKQATLDAHQVTIDANVAALTSQLASINSLLGKVVKTDAIFNSATNFALSTTSATKVSITVTVPAGMTKAAVSVIGRVFAYNPNTSGGPASNGLDYLFANASINGVAGYGMPVVVNGSMDSAMNVAPFADTLSGLTPGSTFTIVVNAATSYLTWAAQTNNRADLSGTVSWYL